MLKEFYAYLDKLLAYSRSIALLHFDMSTTAPKDSYPTIAKTISVLSGELFSLKVSDEMKKYLDYLEKEYSELDDIAKRTYEVCKKEYDMYTKIPKDEFVKQKEVAALGQSKWKEARDKEDFSIFAPVLEELIEYSKKFAGYLGFSESPYTWLIQQYDEDFSLTEVEEYFEVIKSQLVPVVEKVLKADKVITNVLDKEIDLSKNKEVANFIMEYLKYDLNKGLLSESTHPFSINMGCDDVRITTRYEKFIPSLYSVMHETGHALYEQNPMDSLRNTILSGGSSMSIHESQSRFLENYLGRSKSFINKLYPVIMEKFSEEFVGLTEESFYREVNSVNAGFIRVDADELTYSIHVLIRFEIEKLILSGKVKVNDLPKLWADKYEEYLGIRPTTLKEGVLQDVHWSSGMFGYFPSYSIGTAISAQLYKTISKEFDVQKAVDNDEVEKVLNWLKENIHQYGSLLKPKALVKQATGEEFNPKYYIEYLSKKYGELYGVEL